MGVWNVGVWYVLAGSSGCGYLAINGDPGGVLVRWLKGGGHVGIHILQLEAQSTIGTAADGVPVHRLLLGTPLSHTQILLLTILVHAVNEWPKD